MNDSAHQSTTSHTATADARSREGTFRAHLRRVPARPLWVVALAAVVGDLVLTAYGLEIGLRERNPFVAAIYAHSGVVGLVALKAVVVSWVGVVWWALDRHYGVAAVVGLALPQAVAVVLNVLTIAAA